MTQKRHKTIEFNREQVSHKKELKDWNDLSSIQRQQDSFFSFKDYSSILKDEAMKRIYRNQSLFNYRKRYYQNLNKIQNKFVHFQVKRKPKGKAGSKNSRGSGERKTQLQLMRKNMKKKEVSQ